MSYYDESLHRHDKKQKMESRKAASEEMRLQTTAKNRQRGCRRDVRRQTVPNACGGDWKSTIADEQKFVEVSKGLCEEIGFQPGCELSLSDG